MSESCPNINRHYIKGENEYFRFMVHWLRPTESDSENLLMKPARHGFYELHYVLSGSVVITVNGKSTAVSEGEYLLIAPESVHEVTQCEEHTEKWVFGFFAEWKDGHIPNIPAGYINCAQKDTEVLKSLISALTVLGYDTRQHPYSHLQIRSLTEALIAELFSFGEKDFSIDRDSYKKTEYSYKEEWIFAVKDHIGEKVKTENITVGQLANEFHVSVRHLLRVCLEMTGKTPHQLIDESRARCLEELLVTSGETLSAIAIRMGFSSENAMARFFRKIVGYTPSQYRKAATKK